LAYSWPFRCSLFSLLFAPQICAKKKGGFISEWATAKNKDSLLVAWNTNLDLRHCRHKSWDCKVESPSVIWSPRVHLGKNCRSASDPVWHHFASARIRPENGNPSPSNTKTYTRFTSLLTCKKTCKCNQREKAGKERRMQNGVWACIPVSARFTSWQIGVCGRQSIFWQQWSKMVISVWIHTETQKQWESQQKQQQFTLFNLYYLLLLQKRQRAAQCASLRLKNNSQQPLRKLVENSARPDH